MNIINNRIINKLNNRVWKRRGKWFKATAFSEIFLEGESANHSQRLKLPFKRYSSVWFGNGDFFDLESDWNYIRKVIRIGYRTDKQYLSKYSKKCLQQGERVIKFADEIRDNDFTKFTDKELLNLYKKLVTKCKDFMPYMYSLHIFDEFLTDKFTSLLKTFLKRNKLPESAFLEYQTALALPFRKIFVLEERDAFSRLGLKNKMTEADLKKHHYKFAWINSVLWEDRPYSLDYYRKRMKELKTKNFEGEYLLRLKEEKKLRIRQKELMRKIYSDKELYQIAKDLQVFGFLRSFRVDVLYVAFGRCWNLVEEIARRLFITDLDVRYLDYNDIQEAMLRKNDSYKEKINIRNQGKTVSVALEEERYELSDLDVITKLEKIIRTKSVISEIAHIKGTSACAGNVVGECRVLHGLEDMKKVKVGDILVISMTDPNYLPAMERAAAFVTDFGGILCHAAIVSREMNKPCVIGTKIATEVLKDGDRVQVDADNGVIKILEKIT